MISSESRCCKYKEHKMHPRIIHLNEIETNIRDNYTTETFDIDYECHLFDKI